MQDLFTRQLAAFYDPRRGELGIAGSTLGGARKVMSSVTGRDVVGEITIAHELTHALQDQHWGLPVDPVPVLDADTDRVLARACATRGRCHLGRLRHPGGRPSRRRNAGPRHQPARRHAR